MEMKNNLGEKYWVFGDPNKYRWVSVDIRTKDPWDYDNTEEKVTINWCAMGSVDIATAKKFARALNQEIKKAEEVNPCKDR